VFVEKGYDAATMHDIAAAADVSAGSIHRYVENKRDLIAAAANACVQADLNRWDTPLPEGSTPGEAFLHLGEQTRDAFAADEHGGECVLRLESYRASYRDANLRERVVPKMEESVRILDDYVRRSQESGEMDASLDPEGFARFLHVVGSGIGAQRVLYGPDYDTDTVWNQLIVLVSRWFTEDFQSTVME